ncbi:sensor histidine kinase [Dysosmobacter sp.]|uniref:sensor histidine kinase n=1 Tax=Dysosmobacter sp. TaxID=2591382 RepID=UPI002A903A97|nr:DUF4118 domain-containing protein [Dysosmobacter sp.]MDY3281422.1 DUF4118 domain-containing protein [Dysosmobacter sp.]
MDQKRLKELFPVSWRDLVTFVAIMLCATACCYAMRILDGSGEFATLIYVMAVLMVSRFTNGYLFGLLASLLGVLFVNFLFTYPYRAFNFVIAGYPLTFLTMAVVSTMTCAMTNQVRQQEKLRAENEKEKMRANLLRSVSHDIRTPLTSIVGATSTILENRERLSVRDQELLLQDVREEAQWLIRIVENLLSVTRMSEEETARITKTPEAAEEVVGEAARKFRKRFSHISVSVEAPEELLMVPMDAILIEQVLANLLENAAIHGKTTTHIRLSVCREGNCALFTVRDNGGGIPEKQLANLFDDRVRRTEETTAGDKKRNMGLGLTVCKAIVHAHGGVMSAGNLPEGGAEMRFTLPLGEGCPAAEPPLAVYGKE